MPMIETQSAEARNLRGLHLYFAAQSNCSSRVRLLLAEKGLAWTGHHINLLKRENVDPAFFAINPRGLVPVLVHDGRIINESDDIMLYLEDRFPEPGFTPVDGADRARVEDWVHRAAKQHVPTIKTFAYIRRNAQAAAKTPAEIELYYKLQKDPEMVAFHGKHDLPGQGFTAEDERAATALIESIFAEMAEGIEGTGWLAGPNYSLADMAWAASIRTLGLAGYPLERHPAVMAWFARVEARPAWQEIARLWAQPPEQRILMMGPTDVLPA
jgi:glutathione S-transferase